MVAWLLRDAAKGLNYLLRVKEITRSPTTPQRGGGGMLIFHPSSRERERDETRRSVKCACHLVPLLATLATSVAGCGLCSSLATRLAVSEAAWQDVNFAAHQTRKESSVQLCLSRLTLALPVAASSTVK